MKVPIEEANRSRLTVRGWCRVLFDAESGGNHINRIQINTAVVQNSRNVEVQNRVHKENLLLHSYWPMDLVYQFWNASHYSSEHPSDGKFHNCFHKSTILLPYQRETPECLCDLMSNPKNPSDTHFKNNFRSYNSVLSSSFSLEHTYQMILMH